MNRFLFLYFGGHKTKAGNAGVAELADAHGLGPCSERIGGSTPLSGTRKK